MENQETLQSLVDDLKAQAAWLANQNPSQTAEDLFQIMMVKILEKAQTNPEFLHQKPAYILTFATFQAKNQARKDRTYLTYIDEIPASIFQDNDVEDDTEQDEELENPIAFIEDDSVSPEDTFVQEESRTLLLQAIGRMPAKTRFVVDQLLDGHNQAEIAERLKVSKSAVTQRLQVLNKELVKLDLDLR